MNSTKAIFARLIGAGEIVAGLDTIEGAPAIFNDRAPDEFVFTDKAAIVIAAPSGDASADTLTEFGRDITQDIRLYARDTGSTEAIDALTRAVRDLLHARPDDLTVDGGRCSLVTATGPVAASTTDPSLVGRRVSLRLLLERN